MNSYLLSEAATQDIETIFQFGIDRFGIHKAEQYINGLETRLKEIANQPKSFPAVDYLREGYRRSTYRSHSIYYKKLGNGVLIVRILGAQNISTALPT
jgi:toxin ParE1/3/4